jgi:UDP-glucose 4-epimerase
MSRIALVTGGCGFIGSHLVDGLLQQDWTVRIIDDLSTGKLENISQNNKVEIIEDSILNENILNKATQNVQAVFHLAASVSVPFSIEFPEKSFEINAMGTLKVLESCRQNGVRKFINSSSSAVYGENEDLPLHEDLSCHPISIYGAGKLSAEIITQVYAKAYNMQTVSLRYFNVFGERQRHDSPYAAVIPIFFSNIFHHEPLRVFGDGKQTRDFTHVSNVVHANMLALEADSLNGEAVNIASGESISLNELTEFLSFLVGKPLDVVYDEPRVGDIKHSAASTQKAKQLLGYEPKTNWREGLSQLHKHFQPISSS